MKIELYLLSNLLISCFLFSVSCATDNYKRALVTRLNPNCTGDICLPDSGNYLIYTRSLSQENALHYVISGGDKLGPLSVLLITSNDIDSELSFDWKKLTSSNPKDAIKLNGIVHSAHAIILNNIVQFNDEIDSAQVDNSTQKVNWDTTTLKWQNIEKATGLGGVEASNKAVFKAQSVHTDDLSDEIINGETKLFKKDGTLAITLSHSAIKQHAINPPKLTFTGTNILMDSLLYKLASPWNKTRYAFDYILATDRQLKSDESMKIKPVHHLDDEYTPAIFYVYSLLGQPEKTEGNYSCYIQWKPVAYTSPSLITRISSTVQYSNLRQVNSTESLMKSVVYSWFGDDLFSEFHSISLQLSFGTTKDGYYKASDYVVWDNTFGYGEAPEEQISLTVIMIIACGLGLPFVLIIFGGIYIIIKQKAILSSYQKID